MWSYRAAKSHPQGTFKVQIQWRDMKLNNASGVKLDNMPTTDNIQITGQKASLLRSYMQRTPWGQRNNGTLTPRWTRPMTRVICSSLK